MEFHRWENQTFFSWIPSENQTKPNLMAIHNAHVNSSESIRILEASTGSRGKPCGSKGQLICWESGVRIVANDKELQCIFLITFFNYNFLCAYWSQSTLMLSSVWVRLSMFAIWFLVSAIFSVFSRYCQQRRRLGWTGQASYHLAFWRITQTTI